MVRTLFTFMVGMFYERRRREIDDVARTMNHGGMTLCFSRCLTSLPIFVPFSNSAVGIFINPTV